MKSSRKLALPPVVSILLAVFSVQGGATIAKGLFPVIGAAGTAAVRIGLSAIILLAVFRPPVHRFTAAQWRPIVPYGVTIGVMNLLFYQALVRIPLGLAVTLEFVGPLAVAIAGSRRVLDAVWIVLAAIGIALIAPWQAESAIDPLGVAIALLTGGCWAAYIVLGGRVSQLLTGGVAVATGMSIATLTVLPFALAAGGLASFAPRLFAAGVALAVLSEMREVKISRAHQTLAIGAADMETARHLRMALNAPTAEARCVVTDASKVVIYIGEITCPGDCVRLSIELIGQGRR